MWKLIIALIKPRLTIQQDLLKNTIYKHYRSNIHMLNETSIRSFLLQQSTDDSVFNSGFYQQVRQ